jgi:hypothetical protein
MSNYNTTVQYFRVNASNTAIATSNSGDGQTTEEILAPVVGGTYSTTSTGVTITGESGSDFTALSVNQYLYYTDNSGNYILMGQIASIDIGGLDLDLYAAPIGTTPAAGATLSGSFALITNTEPIYMRIATEVVNNTVNIPNFSTWRTSSNVTTGTNNIAVTQLLRVSNVGTPVSIAGTTENIPFTIQTMNQFTVASGASTAVVRYFPTTASFPAFIWIKITPAITNNSLSSKTMYRLTTQENILALACSVNTPLATLQGAGYNITSVITGQDSGNVGQQG